MQEIELRFLVPQARLKGLMRQVKVKSSEVTLMSAHYFDTPKQELAKHGIGLRIRREGQEWVQTIKARGDGIAARLEHNMILDNEQVAAMLRTDSLLPDLSIYKETAIAPALADFKLKKLAKKLTRQYVTDVERTTRLLVDEDKKDDSDKQDKASTIEVAYDYGKIIHGDDESSTQSIQEIEFELVSGELDFLFTTAKVWCKRYKLCLSTVTKAERGGLLINDCDYSPAVRANVKQLAFEQDISMPAFIRAAVHNCLLQILPNSSAIADGSDDLEHVLQLRIGLQRLRTALKAFKKFSEQLNPEWLAILKQTASLLGDYRQIAYLSGDIEPRLQHSGAPKVDWSAENNQIKIKPIDAVRANDFQLTLLELIDFTMSDVTLEAKADKKAKDKLAKVLSKQHIKLLEAAHDFEDLGFVNKDAKESEFVENKANSNENNDSNNSGNLTNDANDLQTAAQTQHKLRRQIKKMRYISEFAAPLYSKKKTKRWLKRLKKAQQVLGESIDNNHYQHYYQQKSSIDANALYGAGWFSAQLKADTKRCKKRLDKMQNATSFW
ncbi:CYTH and CHAD domain-containing protein [Psychrobacter sp. AH5]|uniref:CYTH and CHAD domain-containing protein n=1 Tax=Psychrobacter sp. AH5 TaxID=2937433 RepID=UPI0033409CBA